MILACYVRLYLVNVLSPAGTTHLIWSFIIFYSLCCVFCALQFSSWLLPTNAYIEIHIIYLFVMSYQLHCHIATVSVLFRLAWFYHISQYQMLISLPVLAGWNQPFLTHISIVLTYPKYTWYIANSVGTRDAIELHVVLLIYC